MTCVATSEPSARIHCPALFPLGIALVELGLLLPLSEVAREPEDGGDDSDPMALKLIKAEKLRDAVSSKQAPSIVMLSGLVYDGHAQEQKTLIWMTKIFNR